MKGKTTLIQQNPLKGITPSNYRLITCLPMMWDLLIAQIRKKIYYSLVSCRLFPKEPKGSFKGTKETGNLLYNGPQREKQSEKRDQYLDLARKLRKIWNLRVTVIPIVICTLATVPKGLKELEIRGRIESIQTTTLIRPVRIMRRARETWGDLLSLRLQ